MDNDGFAMIICNIPKISMNLMANKGKRGATERKANSDAKPKNHGSVLNKNIPYSTKISIHSVGPKMDSQDPKDLTIAVLAQIKYMDVIL